MVKTIEENKSAFATGSLLTEQKFSDMLDTVDNTISPVVSKVFSTVSGSTLAIHRIASGTIFSYWFSGVAVTSDIAIPETGLQIASATDFPELAGYQGDALSNEGFIIDSSNTLVNSISVEFSSTGIKLFSQSASTIDLTAGDQIKGEKVLILPALNTLATS